MIPCEQLDESDIHSCNKKVSMGQSDDTGQIMHKNACLKKKVSFQIHSLYGVECDLKDMG